MVKYQALLVSELSAAEIVTTLEATPRACRDARWHRVHRLALSLVAELQDAQQEELAAAFEVAIEVAA